VKIFGFNIGGGEGQRKAIGPREILSNLLGQGTSKSGAKVNWKTALQITTAFACARVIADGLAQVPFKLYQDNPGGGKNPATDHGLYSLLATKPNDWQTSFEFREQIALHLVFCFNAYIWVNRVGGKIVELLAYEPNMVTVKRQGWVSAYFVSTVDGRQIEIPAEDMWHIRGPSWSGWEGLNAITLAREALGLALATEEHSARMFSNGARVGGVLSTDSAVNPEQKKALRESWEETQGGPANAFKTAILWGGLKWSPMAQQNDQAQLIEQRRFQIEEVCRFARVLPIMVGHSDKAATFASAEQMFLAHVVHTMGPWYARLEQSADANLLTEKERSQGLYFKFVPAALMRGAHKDRAEYFGKALGSGGSPAWMTQDEVRELDELNPLGGTAATLREPTNVGTTPKPTDPTPGN
jgi:HK97 family phage portal protein